MESITIQAASPESARAILAALSRVHPSCAADESRVVISLGGKKGELVAVLDALEEYVTRTAAGPTRINLDGHNYVMEGGGVG